jgi:hypothetical protein
MKTFFLAIVVLAIVVLRLNIPENNAGEALAAQQKGVVNELAGQVLYSNAVADWQYRDYLVVKFACSERLKLKLIALPFDSWKEHRRDVESCAGL